MHARDEPVKSEEQLRARFVQGKLRAGHQMLIDVFLVLEAFHHQEGKPERRGRCQARYDQTAKVASCRRRLRGDRHGEAAGQENSCVDGPVPDIGFAAGGGKGVGVIDPADGV